MNILLAEDDETLADFLVTALGEDGHTVDHCADGRRALSEALFAEHDMAILDRGLPGMDGLTLLRTVRAAGQQMPVLVLSGMAEISDRVEGLTAGADDYLVKPFHFSELKARIAALARRSAPGPVDTELHVHDLHLDRLARTAHRQGQLIELQNREFCLLELLMRHAGRVVSRTTLLEQVWSFNFEPHSSVVETHMSRLRAKIDKPFDTPLIHTVRHCGYSIHGPR